MAEKIKRKPVSDFIKDRLHNRMPINPTIKSKDTSEPKYSELEYKYVDTAHLNKIFKLPKVQYLYNKWRDAGYSNASFAGFGGATFQESALDENTIQYTTKGGKKVYLEKGAKGAYQKEPARWKEYLKWKSKNPQDQLVSYLEGVTPEFASQTEYELEESLPNTEFWKSTRDLSLRKYGERSKKKFFSTESPEDASEILTTYYYGAGVPKLEKRREGARFIYDNILPTLENKYLQELERRKTPLQKYEEFKASWPYNTKQTGGILNYKSFLQHYDKKDNDPDYNIKRAYEIYLSNPKSFEKDFATKEKDGWHFPSVDSETNIFLKAKTHPSIQLEYDWYNSPEATEFRKNYKLDTTERFPRYIPRQNTYAEGGEITEDEKAAIRAYMPILEEQAYLNKAKWNIRQAYGNTNEIERDLDGNITNINYKPIREVTDNVILTALGIGAVGRAGIKAGTRAYNKLAKEFVESAPQGADIVTPGTIGRNIDDIRAARLWNKDFGYPDIKYKKALSTEATDNVIKDAITRHNTFYRGVTPPKKPIKELAEKGISMDSPQAAKYMSEYIPPNNTGAARAGFTEEELASSGTLYTTNNKTIAGVHARDNGYVSTVRRPIDLSSTNRRDWLAKNISRDDIVEMPISKDVTNFVFRGPIGSKAVTAVDVTPVAQSNALTDMALNGSALATRSKPLRTTFLDNPAIKSAEHLTRFPKSLVRGTGESAVAYKLVDRFLKSREASE